MPNVALPVRTVYGEVQVRQGPERCDPTSTSVAPLQQTADFSPAPLSCGDEMKKLYGTDGYSNPKHFCATACKALPTCAPPKPGSPPRPRPKRQPPPPPQEIAGEGPCEEDADCAVANGRSCCGCETIEVRSRLHQRPPPPACGCADLGRTQIPLPTGADGEEAPAGPCGRKPPNESEYRAVCRQASCVGIRR